MSHLQDETPTSVFERLQDISLLLKDISNETGIAVSGTQQDKDHTNLFKKI